MSSVFIDVFSWSERHLEYRRENQDRSEVDFRLEHRRNLSRDNAALWASSDICLDLPGDGGYTMRAYDALRHGCIPLYVTHKHFLFPKLPFVGLIPWEEISYFWTLDHSFGLLNCNKPVWRLADPECEKLGLVASYDLLFNQLLAPAMSSAVASKAALIGRWLSGLYWRRHSSCGSKPTAVDHLLVELHGRLSMIRKALDQHFDPVGNLDLYGDLLELKGVCNRSVTGSCFVPFRPGVNAQQTLHPDREGKPDCPFGFPYLQRTDASDFCGAFHPLFVPEWLEDGKDAEHYYAIAWACPSGCLPVPRSAAKGRTILHETFLFEGPGPLGREWQTEAANDVAGGFSLPINGTYRVCVKARGGEAGLVSWHRCRVPVADPCWRRTEYSERTGLRYCVRS